MKNKFDKSNIVQYSYKCTNIPSPSGEWRAVWQKEVANKVGNFKHAIVERAKGEKWFGCVFENWLVHESGLANYLAEIFTQKIFDQERDEMGVRAYRNIPELNYAELGEFREFLKSREFGMMDVETILNARIDDIKKIGKL